MTLFRCPRIQVRRHLQIAPLAGLCTLVFALHSVVICAGQDVQDENQLAPPSAQRIDFFENQIRPILIDHCYECHTPGEDEFSGGLDLTTSSGMLEGGDSGPALVPGSASESLIIEAMRYQSYEMPPDAPLPDHVVDDFVKWIDEGAIDPRSEESRVAAGSESEVVTLPWSYTEIDLDRAPKALAAEWSQSPIDTLVFASQIESGDPPVRLADRSSLVRRAYYDLIGLPPTLVQIEAFVRDERPDAWERLVDRLLNSPQFGERWGRHWLDAVRYADSSGGGRAILFPLAYRYRDYVIASFNHDKPVQQFTREQIAGDLLHADAVDERADQLAALGFLALGPTNFELQDKELLRMEVVDEQIDTIGRVFLAQSIGCARCHDHKFDPIPTRDYYALAGILRSTKTLTPGNVSGYVRQMLPQSELDAERWSTYQNELEQANNAITNARTQLTLAEEQLSQFLAGEITGDGVLVDDSEAQLEGNWTNSTSVKGYVGAGYSHTSAADAFAEYELVANEAGRFFVDVSYTANPNRSSRVLIEISNGDSTERFEINQKTEPTIAGRFDRICEIVLSKDQSIKVRVLGEEANGVVIADSVRMSRQIEDANQPEFQARMDQLENAVNDTKVIVEQLEAEKAQIEQSSPAAPVEVMGVRDEDQTEDYFVCIRGDVHRLGDRVSRGPLSSLRSSLDFPAIEEGSGRLELADWIANDNNPLTARVFVNRIWHHLFGTGIVPTLDNFGNTGEQPSNPQLLDYLASELIHNDGSTKLLIRKIMMSHAYQMTNAQDQANPTEQVLAQGRSVRRVDAEYLRDAMLALGDGLDYRVGFAAFPTSTRNEFDFRDQTRRRTVYLPVFRNNLIELVSVFDFADPNLVSGGRTTTTLPTQALFLMNHPWVAEQAQQTAENLLSMDVSDQERLTAFYRSAVGREPTDQESAILLGYLQSTQENQASPEVTTETERLAHWTSIVHSVFASLDFRFIR